MGVKKFWVNFAGQDLAVFLKKRLFSKKNKYSKNHNSAKNGFKRLGFLVKLANYAQIGIMGVKKFWVNFASQDLAVFLKKRLFSKKNKYLKNHNSAKNGSERLGFLVKLANKAQIGIMGVKSYG